MSRLEDRLGQAVAAFWGTRKRQQRQQARRGVKDQDTRGAVTGGGQLDGCVDLVADLLTDMGVPSESIYRRKQTELPGFFRATKQWDLIVVVDGKLLVSIEFKSMVGSFSNNYNNRAEEAIGNAADLWTAYRDGAFQQSCRPWLGYFMLLQDEPGSQKPVRLAEPHFPAFKEFRNTSYAKRYELLCRKLVRERLYDAACLVVSKKSQGRATKPGRTSADVSFAQFVRCLRAHLTGRLPHKRKPTGRVRRPTKR